MSEDVLTQGEGERVVYRLDPEPFEPPRGDDDTVGSVLISDHYRSSLQWNVSEFGNPPAVRYALDAIRRLGGDLDLFQRWASIFHAHDIDVSLHAGYMQGDEWMLVTVHTDQFEPFPAEDYRDVELVNWARGDVYEIARQELCDHGGWHDVEALGGFYTDEPEGLKDLAMSFFGVEPEEVAA